MSATPSTSTQTVRFGIVGLGFMAATHLKAYAQVPGVEVSALCNPSGRHLDGDFSAVAGNLPGQQPLKLDMSRVRAFKDYQQFVESDQVDVIDICAPTHVHADLAIAAMKAGKHVLCEKPLARTSAEGKRMLAVSESTGRYLMPAMCLRFWPEWAWLKDQIKAGTFGRVLGAKFRRVAQPPGWGQSSFLDGAKSGGALLDLHIHDVDFIRFCFGHPTTVISNGFTKVSGAIDHVTSLFEVEGGAAVTAEGGWAMTPGFGFNMSYTVVFERATADYDLSRGEAALKLHEEGKPTETLKLGGPDGYVGEIQHLTDCIKQGVPPHRVTALDGIRALEVCEAEEKSIHSRQRINLI